MGKNTKRIAALLLAMVMCLALAGCGKEHVATRSNRADLSYAEGDYAFNEDDRFKVSILDCYDDTLTFVLTIPPHTEFLTLRSSVATTMKLKCNISDVSETGQVSFSSDWFSYADMVDLIDWDSIIMVPLSRPLSQNLSRTRYFQF